jgi:murein peptide amidase A
MPRLSGLLSLLSLVLTITLVAPPAADARATSAVLEVRTIGYSVQGRPIRAWHLGDPASPVKAVFIATMHGNEAQPARILQNLRDGRPISGADLWVVPFMNPDGFARHSRRNAHGVDLNRNFPVRWIRQGGAYNSGPRPASEPETQAMMAFLAEIRPSYVVSFHQPLFGVDSSYRKTRSLARHLARYLHLPRKRFTCNNGCHGTMTQWFNHVLPGRAITVEYGHRMTHRQKFRTGPRGLLRILHATR